MISIKKCCWPPVGSQKSLMNSHFSFSSQAAQCCRAKQRKLHCFYSRRIELPIKGHLLWMSGPQLASEKLAFRRIKTQSFPQLFRSGPQYNFPMEIRNQFQESPREKFMSSLLRQKLAGLSAGLQSYCFVAGQWLPIWCFQFQGLKKNTGRIIKNCQSTNSQRTVQNNKKEHSS